MKLLPALIIGGFAAGGVGLIIGVIYLVVKTAHWAWYGN